QGISTDPFVAIRLSSAAEMLNILPDARIDDRLIRPAVRRYRRWLSHPDKAAHQPAPADTITATADGHAPTDTIAAAANPPPSPDTTAARTDRPVPSARPHAMRPNYPAPPSPMAMPANPDLIAAFARAAANKGITLEQYRDGRLRFLRQQQEQLQLQLTKPN